MFKTMKVTALVASIAALSIFGFTSAQAAELKIGYIDINTALQNTAEYQSGMTSLKALRDKKLTQLKALKDKIDRAEKDIMRQSLAMSQEHLSKKTA